MWDDSNSQPWFVNSRLASSKRGTRPSSRRGSISASEKKQATEQVLTVCVKWSRVLHFILATWTSAEGSSSAVSPSHQWFDGDHASREAGIDDYTTCSFTPKRDTVKMRPVHTLNPHARTVSTSVNIPFPFLIHQVSAGNRSSNVTLFVFSLPLREASLGFSAVGWQCLNRRQGHRVFVRMLQREHAEKTNGGETKSQHRPSQQGR